jgi:hypothetical protein
MQSAALVVGTKNLTFSEFVDAADLHARSTLERKTVARLRLVTEWDWAAWQCAGRQVQIFATRSHTVIAQSYQRSGSTLPGSTMLLNLTLRGVQELMASIRWLGSPIRDTG